MSNPHSTGLIKVTIKYDGGYDATWASFEGTDVAHVREQIIEFFNIERANVTGLSLSDLVINVTTHAHKAYGLAGSLGATLVADTPEPSAQPVTEAPVAAGDPWAGVSQQAAPPQESAPVDPNEWILSKITEVATVDELQRLWAENQALFEGAVLDAYKAKGKALTQAAAA